MKAALVLTLLVACAPSAEQLAAHDDKMRQALAATPAPTAQSFALREGQNLRIFGHDALGGRYQLMKQRETQACFQVLLKSGAETTLTTTPLFMSTYDAEQNPLTSRQTADSLTVLGKVQTVDTYNQYNFNPVFEERNQRAPTDSSVVNMKVPKQTADQSNVDTTTFSNANDPNQRPVTRTAIEACFNKQPLFDTRARYLVIERGEPSSFTSDVPFVAWKLHDQ